MFFRKNLFLIIVLFIMTSFSVLYSQEIKSDIFQLARTGTLNEFKKVVNKNPEFLETKNKSGYTPLILACYNGNTEVAKYIIDNCKNINLNNGYGTALMASTIKNNEVLVDYLINKNADTNLFDTNGTTALHYAVIFNLDDIAVKLIKAGAKFDIKDNRGNTAKDYAILKKNTNLLSLFKPKK